MNKDTVKKYFEENNETWLQASYEGDGYAFPTALARCHSAVNIVKDFFPLPESKILDLGCGAGQLCNNLAALGYDVTGVDESFTMFSAAINGSLSAVNPAKYINKDLFNNGLERNSYDVVTSFGVIGYLPNDDILFSEANRLLRDNGIFIVSSRNRLFNMVSLSDHTVEEIESGNAIELVKEIIELYQDISVVDCLNFVSSLCEASNYLLESDLNIKDVRQVEPQNAVESGLNPRQHSPKELSTVASLHGFNNLSFVGVHPHLLMASLNQKFPPTVFNTLSSSLDTLSLHPASLIWSSQFIAVFRKSK